MTVGTIGPSGVLYLGATMFVLAIVCQRVLACVWTHRTSATGAASAAEDRQLAGCVRRRHADLPLADLIGIARLHRGSLRREPLLSSSCDRRGHVLRQRGADARVRPNRLAGQAITVVSQVFLTGRIAARFGVTALLTPCR